MSLGSNQTTGGMSRDAALALRDAWIREGVPLPDEWKPADYKGRLQEAASRRAPNITTRRIRPGCYEVRGHNLLIVRFVGVWGARESYEDGRSGPFIKGSGRSTKREVMEWAEGYLSSGASES